MAIINGELVRELWVVEYETRVFKRRPGENVLDLAGEDAQAGTHVWAATGDEAIEIVKEEAGRPPRETPWLGLIGVRRVGLFESKIINQPPRAPNLQAFGRKGDSPNEGGAGETGETGRPPQDAGGLL